MTRGRLLQFSPRKRPPAGRLHLAFQLTRELVSKASQQLAWTKLSVGCREIILFRTMNPGKIGLRSLMHTFHHPNTICSLSLAEGASEGFLFGLLLHEFGHLGSGGGERDADRWILDNFGIRIQYLGELDLEWVDQASIRKILGSSTPPRRRNPRPHLRRNPRYPCARVHRRLPPEDPSHLRP